MTRYLEPHSNEWFVALEKVNPQQASMTRQIIGLAGTKECCSVCGDTTTHDYEVVGATFGPQTPATIRLCDDCLKIRQETQDEKYRLVGGTKS